MDGHRAQGARRPGSAMITRAPVALASSSSGWFGSASTSTTWPRPGSATSLPSRATVISSRPVITVSSPTKRVFRRSISARHSTATAAATPVNVAPRQTTRASSIASGGGPGQTAPPKRSSIWPVNSASTQLCGAMTGAWLPVQGRNEASARITPTITMLSSATSEMGRRWCRRGHQYSASAPAHSTARTGRVQAAAGRRACRHAGGPPSQAGGARRPRPPTPAPRRAAPSRRPGASMPAGQRGPGGGLVAGSRHLPASAPCPVREPGQSISAW